MNAMNRVNFTNVRLSFHETYDIHKCIYEHATKILAITTRGCAH